MTLLTTVQNACDAIGLSRPPAVIGSQDQQVRELLRFANQAGVELMKAVPWQEITKEYTFETVAAYEQVSSLPADFDRFMNDSMYNRTRSRKVFGPISPQDWQKRLAYPTSSVIEYWFRMRGGAILIYPEPSAGDDVYYEYISNEWVSNAAGDTFYSQWNADTDVALIPENLITLSIIWRFRKAKGLEWETPFAEYQDQVSKRAVQQEGSPTLRGSPLPAAIFFPNVPEGDWDQ